MKQTTRWMSFAFSLFLLNACQKKNDGNGGNDSNNHVYTITNSQKGNLLVDYRRAANGMITYDSSYSTGGFGTGAGLGSQGAVILTDDGFVLAVNAGSNSITAFKVTNHGPVLQSTINSGGQMPISLTEYNHVVFVLNAGGTGNISGFNLSGSGKLSAIAGSTHSLTTSNAGPAQISFVNDGSVLVVTEKNNNKITSYASNGTVHTLTAANATPFGFAAGSNGNIYVSEAAGGAAGASTVSSYHVAANGVIKLVTGPLSAGQSAACWVVVTDNNKYAYASNTGSNNMSSFDVNGNSGVISIKKSIAATSGMKPADAALSTNSQYLYVLTSASNSINCYKVDQGGGLTSIQTITGVPASDVGLAAK